MKYQQSNLVRLKKIKLLINNLEECVKDGDIDMQRDVEYSLDLLEEFLNSDWKDKIIERKKS